MLGAILTFPLKAAAFLAFFYFVGGGWLVIPQALAALFKLAA